MKQFYKKIPKAKYKLLHHHSCCQYAFRQYHQWIVMGSRSRRDNYPKGIYRMLHGDNIVGGAEIVCSKCKLSIYPHKDKFEELSL